MRPTNRSEINHHKKEKQMTTMTDAMPKGYDDPSSEFYIPEEWRGDFLTTPSAGIDENAVRRLAMKRAQVQWEADVARGRQRQDPRHVRLGKEQPIDPISANTRIVEIGKQIMQDQRKELQAIADHQDRVRRAGQTFQSNRSAAEAHASFVAAGTCPCCGRNVGWADIKAHELADGSRVNVCLPCGVTAQQFVIDVMSSDEGRRQSVGAYLHSLNLI